MKWTAWGYDFSPSHWPLTVTVCTGQRQNDGCMGQWGWHTQRKVNPFLPKEFVLLMQLLQKAGLQTFNQTRNTHFSSNLLSPKHARQGHQRGREQGEDLKNMLVKDIKGAGSRVKILKTCSSRTSKGREQGEDLKNMLVKDIKGQGAGWRSWYGYQGHQRGREQGEDLDMVIDRSHLTDEVGGPHSSLATQPASQQCC